MSAISCCCMLIYWGTARVYILVENSYLFPTPLSEILISSLFLRQNLRKFVTRIGLVCIPRFRRCNNSIIVPISVFVEELKICFIFFMNALSSALCSEVFIETTLNLLLCPRKYFAKILLSGSEKLDAEQNKKLLSCTIKYIIATKRFS